MDSVVDSGNSFPTAIELIHILANRGVNGIATCTL